MEIRYADITLISLVWSVNVLILCFYRALAGDANPAVTRGSNTFAGVLARLTSQTKRLLRKE